MAKFFLINPGFELGDRDWTGGSEWSVIKDAINARSGSWVGQFIGANVDRQVANTTIMDIRPGGKLTGSCWVKGGTDGQVSIRLEWKDKDGTFISAVVGNLIPFGGGYVQSIFTDSVAPDRTKIAEFRILFDANPNLTGTWHIDDAEMSGDIIEDIPTTAVISSHRMVTADTIGVFDPLIGTDKYTEFNAGMSDKWSGVYTFIPSLGADLGELVSFIRRLGRTERFFAFDPDRKVPLNGIVNGMTVAGPISRSRCNWKYWSFTSM